MLCKATLILLCVLLELTHSLHLHPRDLNAPFLPCYDYIIVGGGVSGLVVANRLTEDPNGNHLRICPQFPVTNASAVTVLVLEAGDLWVILVGVLSKADSEAVIITKTSFCFRSKMAMVWARSMIGIFGRFHRRTLTVRLGRMTWVEELVVEV